MPDSGITGQSGNEENTQQTVRSPARMNPFGRASFVAMACKLFNPCVSSFLRQDDKRVVNGRFKEIPLIK